MDWIVKHVFLTIWYVNEVHTVVVLSLPVLHILHTAEEKNTQCHCFVTSLPSCVFPASPVWCLLLVVDCWRCTTRLTVTIKANVFRVGCCQKHLDMFLVLSKNSVYVECNPPCMLANSLSLIFLAFLYVAAVWQTWSQRQLWLPWYGQGSRCLIFTDRCCSAIQKIPYLNILNGSYCITFTTVKCFLWSIFYCRWKSLSRCRNPIFCHWTSLCRICLWWELAVKSPV